MINSFVEGSTAEGGDGGARLAVAAALRRLGSFGLSSAQVCVIFMPPPLCPSSPLEAVVTHFLIDHRPQRPGAESLVTAFESPLETIFPPSF